LISDLQADSVQDLQLKTKRYRKDMQLVNNLKMLMHDLQQSDFGIKTLPQVSKEPSAKDVWRWVKSLTAAVLVSA